MASLTRRSLFGGFAAAALLPWRKAKAQDFEWQPQFSGERITAEMMIAHRARLNRLFAERMDSVIYQQLTGKWQT